MQFLFETFFLHNQSFKNNLRLKWYNGKIRSLSLYNNKI